MLWCGCYRVVKSDRDQVSGPTSWADLWLRVWAWGICQRPSPHPRPLTRPCERAEAWEGAGAEGRPTHAPRTGAKAPPTRASRCLLRTKKATAVHYAGPGRWGPGRFPPKRPGISTEPDLAGTHRPAEAQRAVGRNRRDHCSNARIDKWPGRPVFGVGLSETQGPNGAGHSVPPRLSSRFASSA